VDSGECAAPRTLLRLRGTAAVGAFGAGKDAARCEKDDLAVGEFLFEFPGETGETCQYRGLV